MTQDPIQQVEISIEHAKKLIERKKQVYALENNKAFREIISKGFFEDEAIRLSQLLSDPALSPEQRNMVYQDIMALGTLKRYLRNIVHFGTMAEQELRSDEETLDALREESAE